ncbi:hypothetical protein MLD38_016753 [Melastoma candidum]|uniref:Uncharacterized protein n=1 Tax=Melastoma candidum TaxID=119954 RepID=A0ACB9QRJ9_9MYRT|nr:hypothetical protein MLD38_016753 [Melastoma candidum]
MPLNHTTFVMITEFVPAGDSCGMLSLSADTTLRTARSSCAYIGPLARFLGGKSTSANLILPVYSSSIGCDSAHLAPRGS